ncbi:MAG: purine-nucleoside phosphorylase [Vallitalea sp.]|jgi:purine-nucleoside phosphorylase|nr:purine-nucleoside phosphorylase [Vallitalea sp.]
MSTHISAKKGEIAERVILPGDPLRAKYIAETFLTDIKCYNNVRGMLGFTGYYNGKKVSVQGTGMGVPSASIYITELIDEYGVKNLIRVGTCGSLQEEVKIRDVIIAMTASSNSNVNKRKFKGLDFAPCADFELLFKAYELRDNVKSDIHVGGIYTNDTFYDGDKEEIKVFAEHGVMGVEMETSSLYTIAAKRKVKALSLLTVSDSLVTDEETSSEERQKTFLDMMRIALEII